MSQSIAIPVSIGELFDKQTILQIKRQRITDAGKRVHIERELSLLDGIAAGVLLAAAQREVLEKLVAELHGVNSALWDLENTVRACDAAGEFGDRFVASARQIYAGNDRRARIKLQINTLLGSDIVEVKSHSA